MTLVQDGEAVFSGDAFCTFSKSASPTVTHLVVSLAFAGNCLAKRMLIAAAWYRVLVRYTADPELLQDPKGLCGHQPETYTGRLWVCLRALKCFCSHRPPIFSINCPLGSLVIECSCLPTLNLRRDPSHGGKP
eukprot:TRINITY_DN57528_c0_g1_i1.p1 TRINITY_DN57528_c0_g1~~TRINITY_DN57528_c0_g1_i1.p1  ORF type:complete len:133 (+),score=5.68 TRINITY_DN57528_c0_g1_i1:104-502(+)